MIQPMNIGYINGMYWDELLAFIAVFGLRFTIEKWQPNHQLVYYVIFIPKIFILYINVHSSSYSGKWLIYGHLCVCVTVYRFTMVYPRMTVSLWLPGFQKSPWPAKFYR